MPAPARCPEQRYDETGLRVVFDVKRRALTTTKKDAAVSPLQRAVFSYRASARKRREDRTETMSQPLLRHVLRGTSVQHKLRAAAAERCWVRDTHTHKKRIEKGISLRTSKFKSTRIFCNLSMPERPGSLLSSLQSTRVQTGKAPDRFPFPPRDVERTPYPAPKTARKVEDRAARYDLRSAHDLSRRRRETKGKGIGSRARANRSSRRRFSLQKTRLASWRAGHPDAPAAVNTVRGPKTAAEAVPGKRGGKERDGRWCCDRDAAKCEIATAAASRAQGRKKAASGREAGGWASSDDARTASCVGAQRSSGASPGSRSSRSSRTIKQWAPATPPRATRAGTGKLVRPKTKPIHRAAGAAAGRRQEAQDAAEAAPFYEAPA